MGGGGGGCGLDFWVKQETEVRCFTDLHHMVSSVILSFHNDKEEDTTDRTESTNFSFLFLFVC